MTALRVLFARLLGRGRAPAELETEFAAHFDLLAADLERAGLGPDAARPEAKRRLGNLTAIREIYREQRRLPRRDPRRSAYDSRWGRDARAWSGSCSPKACC